MIATAGVLSGYNGSFEFKEPGQKYDDTPYYGMRLVHVYYSIVFLQSHFVFPSFLSPSLSLSHLLTLFSHSLVYPFPFSLSFHSSSNHSPSLHTHTFSSPLSHKGECPVWHFPCSIGISYCLGVGSFDLCCFTISYYYTVWYVITPCLCLVKILFNFYTLGY